MSTVLCNAAVREARFSRERQAGYDPAAVGEGTVLVAGAGALAQNLLVNLALSGVGELRVVDFDTFEDHNASRSPLFPTGAEQRALGMQKARVVASKVAALMRAPQPRARFAAAPVQALGMGAFDGVDVVAACVDDREARAYLGDACRLLGVTLVEGGFHGPEVSLSCFPPAAPGAEATDPCYRCAGASTAATFSCERAAAASRRAGVVPAIQSAAATLGGLQAEAVIQALHGRHAGCRRLHLDIRSGAARTYELTRDPGCPGAHRRLVRPATDLRCSATDTLGTLLEEAEQTLGRGCAIALRERIVCEDYCHGCGMLVVADVPDWSWRAQPHCVGCGGPFARCGPEAGNMTPQIVTDLGANTRGRLRTVTCRCAGLPALTIVEARPSGRATGVSLRLAGALDDLFETAPQAP